MIIGTSIGQEICPILGQVSLRGTSRRICVLREETDKKSANIQARSFLSRTLDVIGTS